MADGIKRAGALVRRALSGHAAIGLLISAALYLVCLSGALAVLQEYLQRWEEPAAAEMPSISPIAAQHALESIVARQGKPTTHAFIHLPTDGLPRVVITTDNGAAYVDASGNYDAPEAHVWTEFVLFLHYYLNLPQFWGLLATGTLGVMLCGATVTGVLAHPRIFRDAFRMRLRGRPQLSRSDLHNRFGVWLLPFVAVLGFTGAILGLGELVFLGIAQERYQGEFEASYAPLFGAEPKADTRPAPMARADRALAWMAEHQPQHRVTYVTVEDPGTTGQRIEVLASHDRRLIYGETYLFDGQGQYLGHVGLSDGPSGRQAIASIYKLHFGTFGGAPVVLAYFVFGLALCAVISTGTTLWLMKRRSRGYPSPRLEAMWGAVIWGSPMAIVLVYWLRTFAGAQAPLVPVFWGILMLCCLLAAVRPGEPTLRRQRAALGCGLFATGVGHFALASAHPASSVVIDASLALAGTVLVLLALERRKSGKAGERKPSLTPLPK
ncbi:PepSY-associated TM helix domain-containing protein [Novosphingobium album (ex Hu et al. 2023)]|uniref:PepSY domain-containing protein n=1 Tax=Novosphingobium album (ex Hu et al. 2023) TaxID=2930093 RepID=A0ABT0B2V3_9SPHN|nr:PepSY-associated TM helix domain-containing protein [Novosphingobium album (ex Hu et al. 2023)]MCJ2179391.1 PepSY domain-containing protein [Novosphingobium album (ex Hu et al. 2023)]